MSLFRRPLTETASAPKTTFRERAAAWGKRGLKGFFLLRVSYTHLTLETHSLV